MENANSLVPEILDHGPIETAIGEKQSSSVSSLWKTIVIILLSGIVIGGIVYVSRNNKKKSNQQESDTSISN